MLGSFISTLPTNDGKSTLLYIAAGIANVTGGSAGASVTTTVSQGLVDQYGGPKLPGSYVVLVSPSQPCLVSVASKTSSSFNVILTSSPATATLAAGTFDVAVIS